MMKGDVCESTSHWPTTRPPNVGHVVRRTFDFDGCVPRNAVEKFLRYVAFVDPSHRLALCCGTSDKR